jgi:hypothetical protein
MNIKGLAEFIRANLQKPEVLITKVGIVVISLVLFSLRYDFIYSILLLTTPPISVEKRINIEKELRQFALHQQSVVTINNANIRFLTGFVVDPRGYIVTAAHGKFRNSSRIEISLYDGRNVEIREGIFINEIQTLDIALLKMGKSLLKTGTVLPTKSVSFDNLTKILMRGMYYFDDKINIENRMVVIRCINENVINWTRSDRILIGKLVKWEEYEPEIRIEQLQGEIGGCSGAPVFSRIGKILGMVKSGFGTLIFAIDTPTLEKSVYALISESQNKEK